MEAENLGNQVIPMDLAEEEIQRVQNAQLFKARMVESVNTAILKVPNVRERWDVYFMGSDQIPSFEFAINVGKIAVQFTVKLCYSDRRATEYEEGFVFMFKPKQMPHPLVKTLKGKFLLEFLNREQMPYHSYESPTHDWMAIDSYPYEQDDWQCTELPLNRDTALEDGNLGLNDTLSVRLTFTSYSSKVLEYPNAYMLEESVASKADSVLYRDLEALLHNPEDADVEIKTKDGVIFKAHKLILKSRVPMLRAMFATDMLEKSSGVVETPEISSEAMRILLEYIYTGKLHKGWREWRQCVHEVINGANQYELKGLIKYYDRLLITLCTDVDAEDLLEVAKVHGLRQAEEDISKWIRGVVME